MSSGPSFLDLIKQTTDAVAEFIVWVVALFQRNDWFKLLVLGGVVLALLGSVFKSFLENLWPWDATLNALWISLWTAVILFFVGAFVVALVKRPRPDREAAVDIKERKAIKGLRPFGPEDVEIFAQLQRQTSLRECLETITSPGYKFGILMGESGCGKTSFLQAGLWPKLQAEGCSHRGILVRFSDQDPLETIRRALADQLEIPLDWLGLPFGELLHQAVNNTGKPIVLLCDQFEQFFVHYKRKEDREPFIQALTAWYNTPALNQVKLLVSVRADLLHELYALHTALKYNLGPQDLTKLEKFSPEEAAKILGVIAQTENLAFDPRFVEDLAAQELSSQEDGTISPVDLQILAWMIERQKSDDLRAFNREAFQKFGGVEGLLTRFLERTLDARVLPNQREVAVKTLLALTDLDRQVRAGVLTPEELQIKLSGDVSPADLTEAVTWLARSDVRLITPQDKGAQTGYELAHERLIPALMRLANKELTAADKANQLLERRVNEWLGNQQNSRYLLGLKELWQIQRQRPYLVWGAKRKQKEKLVALSKRRTYGLVGAVGACLVAGMLFWGWWNFTPQGQVQQVKWELNRLVRRADDDATAQVAAALIKTNQRAKGFDLIENHISSNQGKARAIRAVAEIAPKLPQTQKPVELVSRASGIAEALNEPSSKANALRAIATAYGQLENGSAAQAGLDNALAATEALDEPSSKAYTLRAIATAYGQLENGSAAQAVLDKALVATEAIDNPFSKADTLRYIATAYGQLEDASAAQAVLDKALAATETIDNPSFKADTLRYIATAYGQLENGSAAQAVLDKALAATEAIDNPSSKAEALGAIATAYRQLGNGSAAQAVLDNALATTEAIDNPYSKAEALRYIAIAYGQLEDASAAQAGLDNALAATETIDNPSSKGEALSAIATAYGQLEDASAAQVGLDNALAATETIDDPSKADALSAIATAYGQLQLEDESAVQAGSDKALAALEAIDSSSAYTYASLGAMVTAYGQLGDELAALAVLDKALAAIEALDVPSASALGHIATACGQLGDIQTSHSLLLRVRQVAERGSATTSLLGDSAFFVLGEIATYQALYGEWGEALRTLKTAFASDKVGALAQMLSHHAESKTPQLIDGPKVLAVDPTQTEAGPYQFAVTLQSPDQGCDRHADWWEVLTEAGDLITRQLLDSPHKFEKPFTTETTLTVDPAQTLIVRAHFSRDSDGNENNGVVKYTNQAMQGSIHKGFKSVRIPPRFAAKVERQAPQPGACKDK